MLETGRPYLPSIIMLMVFSGINSLGGIVFALLSQRTIDSAVAGDTVMLVAFAIGMVVCALAQIAFRALSGYWGERVSIKVENGYRTRLFDFILDRDFQQLTKYHSGELMNRMTDDVNIIVSGVTSFLPSIAQIIVSLVGAGSVLLLMDWRFLVIYLFATLSLIVINKIFRHAIKTLSAEVREKDGKVRSYFQDAIGSLLVLRVFVTEDSARERSNSLQKEFYGSYLNRAKVRIKSNSAMGLSMDFGHVFALVWCSFQLVTGQLSYGSLVAIMQLTGQVRMPFISASNLASQYYSMIASGERLMEIEALAPELTEEQKANLPKDFDARDLYQGMSRIVAEDLVFGYERNGADGPTLKQVSFQVEKGDFVAVMGQSGCGKSTLFKLILGVYHAQSGRLFLDCQGEQMPLSPVTRRLFAYVPQGNLLISGRLRDNIAFAKPDATDDQIWEACRIACAEEFLRKLPDGLDTVVGEHGAGLSEGQMQRVAVARAYLSGAPILLLDEATSALDEATEAKLLENLRTLNDRTCLIVTHRRAALDICNKTVFIEDGRLRS
ncbi:MAG: ABC transporter ATP-binding protein [Coriobacteriia bacterium]|nr:ABC transporter ATP-binding protein [Coriobacteriia bacterium]